MDKDVQGVTQEAADLLEEYASYVRTVKADDLERHPYLPEIERVAAELRLASQPTEEAVACPAIRDRIVDLLRDDPVCKGRVSMDTVKAIVASIHSCTQTAAIGAEARKHVAKIIADFTGFRQWDDMANDRGQLREFIKRGYDVNEPTKDDCLDAASAILATLSQPVAAPQAEMAGGGRKWFPHLDFTGEPMLEGRFRELYPMQEELAPPQPEGGTVEKIAAILLGNVNAPEQVIYRVAREIAALQPEKAK